MDLTVLLVVIVLLACCIAPMWLMRRRRGDEHGAKHSTHSRNEGAGDQRP